ncbi:VOC family protein [Streptomyces sp. SBT349]|uniref:VOC family protein n=1 Tax=Streptomyces sp. SBT349 TaxID=1580539 RepID=UPI00066BE4DF|nr:VOC family protein [Streptomyces sp. SBT349]
MGADGRAHVRLARPTGDLAAAERFWTGGLGLSVLFRKEGLLMVGWPDAGWHLELVAAGEGIVPAPTPEDLLVVYLGEEVPEELVARCESHGGTRVAAHNPYWDTWGVTLRDPDGYRLVLSTRDWG